METTAVVLAWIIIIIICLLIAPFFTISAIFWVANMPILSFIFMIIGVIYMGKKCIKMLDGYI